MRSAAIHQAFIRRTIRSAPMSVAVQTYPIPLTLSANIVSALNNPRGVLRIVAQRDGTTVTVYAGGEVDAANEHSWQQLLREAAAATPPPGPLVIDTDGLDFMGCCAFSALAEEADRCRRRGIRMCVVSCKPIVGRIITAGGLGSRLAVYSDAHTALSAAAADMSAWRSKNSIAPTYAS
jgi:anti-anti-sigma factor